MKPSLSRIVPRVDTLFVTAVTRGTHEEWSEKSPQQRGRDRDSATRSATSSLRKFRGQGRERAGFLTVCLSLPENQETWVKRNPKPEDGSSITFS